MNGVDGDGFVQVTRPHRDRAKSSRMALAIESDRCTSKDGYVRDDPAMRAAGASRRVRAKRVLVKKNSFDALVILGGSDEDDPVYINSGGSSNDSDSQDSDEESVISNNEVRHPLV